MIAVVIVVAAGRVVPIGGQVGRRVGMAVVVQVHVAVEVAVEVAVSQGGVVDLCGELVVVGGLQQLQVVHPSRRGRRGRRGRFGSGLGVGVAADAMRDRQPHRRAVVADLDGGQVERVEDQLDLAAGQGWFDLVEVAVQ